MVTPDMALVLCDLVIVIVVARAAGWAFTRIGQPAVVGEIVAGVLLGPTLLGDSVTEFLFPLDQRGFLDLLANVGLVFFMFVVGLELDIHLVRGFGRVAGGVSAMSILLPFALGIGVALLLAGDQNPRDQFWPFALFVGASMSVTAFPVLARILTDRSMHQTQTGGLALACAAAGDLIAWTLLAVVIGIVGGASDSGSKPWLVVLAAPFAAVMLLVVRPRLAWLTGAYERVGTLTPTLLALILVGLLASSAVTELLHVHFIFGAFLFGAIMPRDGSQRLRLEILSRLEQISVVLLLPVFFLVSGLQVDLRHLGPAQVLQLLVILAVAIIGKGFGAFLGARLQGVPQWQAWALAVLMNTRGLTELIILNVGRQLDLIGPQLFSMLVVMALVTTLMTAPLLRRAYPPERVARDIAEAERQRLSSERLAVLVVASDDDQRNSASFDVALALAGQRRPVSVAVSSLQPFHTTRLEVGSGLTDELVALTESLTAHEALVSRGAERGVRVDVLARFSNDIGPEVVAQAAAMGPEWVLVGSDHPAFGALTTGTRRRLVGLPDSDLLDRPLGAVRIGWDGGPDAEAALVLGLHIAAGRKVPVALEVVSGASARKARGVVSTLRGRGVDIVETSNLPAPVLRVVTWDASAGDVRVRAEDQPRRPDWKAIPLPVVVGASSGTGEVDHVDTRPAGQT